MAEPRDRKGGDYDIRIQKGMDTGLEKGVDDFAKEWSCIPSNR